MSRTIVVRGLAVDLDEVYGRMVAEADQATDGRLIHSRGLKYLLAEMYGLHADAGVPSQPLFDLRRGTATALRNLGWVAGVSRNSGRYVLTRDGHQTEDETRVPIPPAPAPVNVPRRPTPGIHRNTSDVVAAFFTELSKKHGLFIQRAVGPTGNERMGLYSQETPPLYRYAFAEWWSACTLGDLTAWVLLNPGVGDTEGTPRNILGRCRNLSRSWGSSGLAIVNLFAFRARDPNDLPAGTAVGPANDDVLVAVTAACGTTVAGWGNGGRREQRAIKVRPLLSDPLCLTKNGKRVTDRGEPFYPKAISGATQLLPLP